MMSGKWKKIIWAMLMLQLVFIHLAVSAALFLGGFYVSGIFLPGLYFHGYNIGKIIFFLLWTGAFVTGGCYYLGYRKFRRECITFLYPVTDETVKQQYIAACEEVNLKKRNTASLYYNDRILSPFIMGYPNQLLLLPEEVQKNENLQLLMLHECYHMKQRDNGYKLFLLAANCLIWFHPFAYLLRSISYRDIEIACDEAVVKGKSKEERYRYGQFLIDSIQKGKKKNLAYSTFFYGSKNLMKARISAVMEEEKKWDLPAQAAILLLILETAAAGIGLLDSAGEKYEEMTKPFDLYENYRVPEFYTDAAVEAMIQLEPVEKDSYYEDLWERDRYEEKEYDEIEAVPEGPWQLRVKDPDFYGRNLDFFLERFLYYYEDQEAGSLIDYEAGGGGYRAEVIWSRLLAGDQEESVWAIRFKEYVTDYENLPQYQNGWVRISDDGASRHAYYEVAVHIQMVEPYLYELEGIADLEETLTAYEEKYPNADFSDIPQLYIEGEMDTERNQTAGRGDSSLNQKDSLSSDASGEDQEPSSQAFLTEHVEYEVMTEGDTVEFRPDDTAEWIAVPVSKTDLLDDGDPMTGTSGQIRRQCYQCDQVKQIFAYGNETYGQAGRIPLSVTYYEDGTWETSVVSEDYMSGGKLFLSFPEDDSTGYLLAVTERVMWTEATVLFQTTDGGKTWLECDMDENMAVHSLTMDFNFISNEVGFITIHDSNTPDVRRTLDGGKTWERLEFPDVPEYFCSAYAPKYQQGELGMYIGMEEYTEDSGEKAYYTSSDGGVTWEYQGQVLKN